MVAEESAETAEGPSWDPILDKLEQKLFSAPLDSVDVDR